MNSRIPIFPLNLVMYPSAIYPLYIFEERYKKLINRCISENIGFGIVSKLDDTISTVGCYVTITEIINTYDDGRYDILIKGIERFQVITTDIHEDGYLLADITPYIDEDQYTHSHNLEDKTLEKFKTLLDKTAIDLEERFWEKFNRANLKSYKIAEKAGLNLKQQQSLLALRSEDDRLEFLFEHFKRLEDFLEKDAVLREIVAGDGYLN